MKLWKCVKPGEIISVGELYKRYFGDTGSPYDYELFFECLVRNNAKLEVIPFTRSEPYRVTRNKTFFEKVLDRFQQMCYTVVTVKEMRKIK